MVPSSTVIIHSGNNFFPSFGNVPNLLETFYRETELKKNIQTSSGDFFYFFRGSFLHDHHQKKSWTGHSRQMSADRPEESCRQGSIDDDSPGAILRTGSENSTFNENLITQPFSASVYPIRQHFYAVFAKKQVSFLQRSAKCTPFG